MMSSHRAQIFNIAVEQATSSTLLMLQSEEDGRILLITISRPDLERLYYYLTDTSTGRPSTHQLMLNALGQLGVDVEKVEITGVKDNVYLAETTLREEGGGLIELDSRPSDAIALAVIVGAPILIRDEVLAEHGMTLEQQVAESADIDQEVEDFRDFLDQVSPDQFRDE